MAKENKECRWPPDLSFVEMSSHLAAPQPRMSAKLKGQTPLGHLFHDMGGGVGEPHPLCFVCPPRGGVYDKIDIFGNFLREFS